MTDVHCHLLFNVDDGSRSIEESIKLLNEMKKMGFDNVILTPHFIEGSEYTRTNQETEEKLVILKQELKKKNIDINLYLGNEIFINSNIPTFIKNNYIHPLNNSRYLLIELPFHNQILNLEDIIYELKYQGYIPVIAHPERYTYFHDDYSLVDKLKEEEVLFQVNYTSIIGYYGKDSEKLVKYMYKKKYVNFLGTDLHNLDRLFIIENFKKIKKSILNCIGEKYYNQIMTNCDKILSDEDI